MPLFCRLCSTVSSVPADLWRLVLLLLCHPRAYGLLFWAMSSFAFYFVCVYGFAALYFLSRSGGLNFSLARAKAC